MRFYRFEIFTKHPDKKDGDISFEYGENLEEIRKSREDAIKHNGPNVVIGPIQEANYVWSDLEGERCWGTRGKRKSSESGMTAEEILKGTEAFIRQNFRAKDDTDEESQEK